MTISAVMLLKMEKFWGIMICSSSRLPFKLSRLTENMLQTIMNQFTS
jgi:hypothetical protein